MSQESGECTAFMVHLHIMMTMMMYLHPGQAEAVTEPKPSLLPDTVLTELAPRIELSKYNISNELLQDLYVCLVLLVCTEEWLG